MKIRKEFDFSQFSGFLMQCRAQSFNQNSWELVLETDSSNDRFSSYSAFFEAYENGGEFENIIVLFEDFHQRINGTVNPDEIPLDLAKIKSFGIRAFGGVYEDFKQNGPSTLEIDFIKLI